MGLLEGKIAIVTGAGRGLGRAIARRFADEGAKVALLSRTAGPLNEAVSLIRDAGGTALGIPCDMMEEDAVRRAILQVADSFGTIDILVNNAHDTSFTSMSAPVNDVTAEQALHQFKSGPIQVLNAMQACFPHLKKSGGRVINIGSAVGIKGMAGLAPYAMAKEALRALTRVAAREWGQYGITVNNICPAADTEAAAEAVASGVLGRMEAPPIRRLGSPYDDIAPVIVFLASDAGGYMTGYSLMTDGGACIDTAR